MPIMPALNTGTNYPEYIIIITWLSTHQDNFGVNNDWVHILEKRGIYSSKVHPNRRGYNVSFTYYGMRITTNMNFTFAYAERKQRTRTKAEDTKVW